MVVTLIIQYISIIAASVAHGRGDGTPLGKFGTKGTWIVLSVLYGLYMAFYSDTRFQGITYTLTSFSWWWMFRTGKQAKAELDAQGMPRGWRIRRVREQYYLPVQSCIVACMILLGIAGEWWYLPLPLLLWPTCFAGWLFLNNVNQQTSLGQRLIRKANGTGGYLRMATELVVTAGCSAVCILAVNACAMIAEPELTEFYNQSKEHIHEQLTE